MSGFYIGVDGKARKVKGSYIGVDGVARKVKKGYIGVDGVARLCYADDPFDPVFANNTWEDVIAACHNNAVPDTWSVGDQMKMAINGTNYTVDIIGKNHDNYADGSGKAPLTFQLHDCYKTTHRLHSTTSNTSWGNTEMYITTLPSIFNLMSDEVKNGIRNVKKSTGGKTTVDALFLLSEYEIFGANEHSSVHNEGVQYDYYKNGGNKVKKVSGVKSLWWSRSDANISLYYCAVNAAGERGYETMTTTSGVSFAFCF